MILGPLYPLRTKRWTSFKSRWRHTSIYKKLSTNGKVGQEQVNSLWHKDMQGESLKIVRTTYWNSQTTTFGLKASGKNHRHQQGFKRGSFEKAMHRTSIGAFWPFPGCRQNTQTYNSRTPTPSGQRTRASKWRLSKTSMIIPSPRKLSMS